MRISITPVPKPRMTQRDRWAKRPAVVRYYAYCDLLRVLLPDYQPSEKLVLEFGVPMPKSWSAKKRSLMEGKPHRQRPDIDNLAKAIMDALCEDDSYIYSLKAEKYWSDEPYIEIS